MKYKNWKEEQIKIYDEMAKHGHQYIYKKESLIHLDKIIPKNGKILDIGCGTGHVAEVLNDREWYGVDISPKSVERAKNYYIEAKVGDITKRIPFEDDFFDTVLSLSTLHHVYDEMGSVLSEVRRVLKNNGLFIAIEHDARNLHTKLMHHSLLRVVPCQHERALYQEELLSLLEQNNFYSITFSLITIRADQQSCLPPPYVRIVKGPILVLLKLLVGRKPDQFLLRAKVRK